MKSILIPVLCVWTCLGARGQSIQSPSNGLSQFDVDKRAESIYSSLVELRRDLHRHPELSGNERRTSAMVSKYLRDLGLEVEDSIGGFGVVGVLKGASPGPVVAWRADMDALADSSTDPVDFPSTNPGVRHVCGHDVHTVIGLGIANVLCSMRDQLAGTVMFIFQPAEESFTGARAMLDAGLFDRLKPDMAFALHLAPLPTGVGTTKRGEMFAYRTRIAIELKDVTEEEEAMRICAALVNALNSPPGLNIFSVPPGDSEQGIFNPRGKFTNYFAVHGTPKVERYGGGRYRVVSNAFASSDSIVVSSVGRLRESFRHSPLKDQLLTLEHFYAQPVVTNNPEVAERSLEILQAKYGPDHIIPLCGIFPGFNDDFVFLQRETSGVYFFLGASDFAKGVVSMPHAPNFSVDEASIKTGVAYFSWLILQLAHR